jgi:hypothetical protein
MACHAREINLLVVVDGKAELTASFC